MYPSSIQTDPEYISTSDWPPKVRALSEKFSCLNAGQETMQGGKTEEKTLNGIPFCVTTESGGAAGSTYANYAYAFEKEGKKVVLTFALRYVQCLNYSEPKTSACQAEQKSFSPEHVDSMAYLIANTVKFLK